MAKKKKRKPEALPGSMTSRQYLAALKTLDRTIDERVKERFGTASQRTSNLLGMSVRQCQRIGFGEVPVPETVARLLKLCLAIPKARKMIERYWPVQESYYADE